MYIFTSFLFLSILFSTFFSCHLAYHFFRKTSLGTWARFLSVLLVAIVVFLKNTILFLCDVILFFFDSYHWSVPSYVLGAAETNFPQLMERLRRLQVVLSREKILELKELKARRKYLIFTWFTIGYFLRVFILLIHCSVSMFYNLFLKYVALFLGREFLFAIYVALSYVALKLRQKFGLLVHITFLRSYLFLRRQLFYMFYLDVLQDAISTYRDKNSGEWELPVVYEPAFNSADFRTYVPFKISRIRDSFLAFFRFLKPQGAAPYGLRFFKGIVSVNYLMLPFSMVFEVLFSYLFCHILRFIAWYDSKELDPWAFRLVLVWEALQPFMTFGLGSLRLEDYYAYLRALFIAVFKYYTVGPMKSLGKFFAFFEKKLRLEILSVFFLFFSRKLRRLPLRSSVLMVPILGVLISALFTAYVSFFLFIVFLSHLPGHLLRALFYLLSLVLRSGAVVGITCLILGFIFFFGSSSFLHIAKPLVLFLANYCNFLFSAVNTDSFDLLLYLDTYINGLKPISVRATTRHQLQYGLAKWLMRFQLYFVYQLKRTLTDPWRVYEIIGLYWYKGTSTLFFMQSAANRYFCIHQSTYCERAIFVALRLTLELDQSYNLLGFSYVFLESPLVFFYEAVLKFCGLLFSLFRLPIFSYYRLLAQYFLTFLEFCYLWVSPRLASFCYSSYSNLASRELVFTNLAFCKAKVIKAIGLIPGDYFYLSESFSFVCKSSLIAGLRWHNFMFKKHPAVAWTPYDLLQRSLKPVLLIISSLDICAELFVASFNYLNFYVTLTLAQQSKYSSTLFSMDSANASLGVYFKELNKFLESYSYFFFVLDVWLFMNYMLDSFYLYIQLPRAVWTYDVYFANTRHFAYDRWNFAGHTIRRPVLKGLVFNSYWSHVMAYFSDHRMCYPNVGSSYAGCLLKQDYIYGRVYKSLALQGYYKSSWYLHALKYFAVLLLALLLSKSFRGFFLGHIIDNYSEDSWKSFCQDIRRDHEAASVLTLPYILAREPLLPSLPFHGGVTRNFSANAALLGVLEDHSDIVKVESKGYLSLREASIASHYVTLFDSLEFRVNPGIQIQKSPAREEFFRIFFLSLRDFTSPALNLAGGLPILSPFLALAKAKTVSFRKMYNAYHSHYLDIVSLSDFTLLSSANYAHAERLRSLFNYSGITLDSHSTRRQGYGARYQLDSASEEIRAEYVVHAASYHKNQYSAQVLLDYFRKIAQYFFRKPLGSLAYHKDGLNNLFIQEQMSYLSMRPLSPQGLQKIREGSGDSIGLAVNYFEDPTISLALLFWFVAFPLVIFYQASVLYYTWRYNSIPRYSRVPNSETYSFLTNVAQHFESFNKLLMFLWNSRRSVRSNSSAGTRFSLDEPRLLSLVDHYYHCFYGRALYDSLCHSKQVRYLEDLLPCARGPQLFSSNLVARELQGLKVLLVCSGLLFLLLAKRARNTAPYFLLSSRKGQQRSVRATKGLFGEILRFQELRVIVRRGILWFW